MEFLPFHETWLNAPQHAAMGTIRAKLLSGMNGKFRNNHFKQNIYFVKKYTRVYESL